MSDLGESYPFDLEAQKTLLQPTHEPESTSRQTWKMLRLLIRSANLFKLSGENYFTCSSSFDSSVSILSPAYTSVGTADGEDNAGSEIVEAARVSLELHEDSLIGKSKPQNEFTSTIELQCIQMGNITEMVKRMNLDELHNYGGVQGVADALNTDLINGLSDDHEAISKCNKNELSPALNFFHFFKEGCNNYPIFLLSLAAVLSLSFGINEEGVANGWFDGTILIVSIFVLVVFIAIRSYSQARWYKKKFQKQWFSEGRNGKVKVIRSGGPPLVVPSSDLRVGDLVCLQKGYQIPADGIFVPGQSLQLDDGIIDNKKPFLLYGSRVIDGDARMIVTSVGTDTVWSEMIGNQSPEKKCEFEVLLHKLRTCVDFFGLLHSILILIVMFLRYSLGKRDDESGYRPDPKGEPTRLKTIIDIIKGIIIESKGTARVLIASLSVSMVGIMEGIPFVISCAVALRSRKTLAENASEKDPLACVKVALVTAICTDKFGGLTEHQKEVDKFFVDKGLVGESSMVSPNVLESLCDGIGISLLSSSPNVNDLKELVLISWAEDKFGLRRETLSPQCRIVKYEEGNLFPECSGALLLKTTENGQEWHLHYKGPPQDILSMCSCYYNVEGEVHAIDAEKRRMFEQASDYMLDGQEVIAYAWKRTDGSNDMSTEENDLIFVGMVGLRNINQDFIRKAVSTLREGGVRTILASGDCIDVLRTIGNNCGLLTPESDALTVTGEEFRKFTDGERMQKLDRICIMGNCTLHDKVLLVKCLREKGEVVAMLGQKTNDAPALKEADIGLTLGPWSSEMARDCSEIFILNGDFTFLVNLIKNGRCICENIRKFIQFQLIITISSSSINFIATIVWGDAPMTAFELFWLNLAVALLGGLALLTERPKEITMKMSPKSYRQLVTKAMWRNIAIQASYQTAICLTLLLKGRVILGIGVGTIKFMIYNSLFLCQLFNIFIDRELEKKNIFKGLHQNRWFWVACVLFLLCQAAMVAAANVLDNSTRLNWMLWASCILVGLVSWPLDFAGKWIGSLGFLS